MNKLKPVSSIVETRRNSSLILEVSRLWIKPTDVVMDVTYGNGRWWDEYQHPGTFIRHDINHKKGDGVDFRNLPEPRWSVDVIAFDPNYVAPGGRETSTVKDMHEDYGMTLSRNPTENLELIREGISECATKLAGGGILMVKCMDYISGGKLVLGHHAIVNYAMKARLRQVDEFIHFSGTGPQPTKNLDGSDRKQVHSRRAHSFLCIFQAPKSWPKRQRELRS